MSWNCSEIALKLNKNWFIIIIIIIIIICCYDFNIYSTNDSIAIKYKSILVLFIIIIIIIIIWCYLIAIKSKSILADPTASDVTSRPRQSLITVRAQKETHNELSFTQKRKKKEKKKNPKNYFYLTMFECVSLCCFSQRGGGRVEVDGRRLSRETWTNV